MAEITELVKQLRNGVDASDKLIELLTPLALRTAKRYSIFNQNKIEDIRSCAMLGLVQAIRWAPERLYDDNIQGYVVETCKRFIREFLENDHLIPVKKDALKKGASIPVVYSIQARKFRNPETEENNDPPAQPKESESIEYQEVICTLSLSDKEFKALTLRLKGYTLQEIGQLMGYANHSPIVRILKSIGNKYRRIINGLSTH